RATGRGASRSWKGLVVHPVRALERVHVVVPDPLVARLVHDGLADHPQAVSAMFTCTVPSSFGSARMSRVAISKYMSFSNPLAAMMSQRPSITASPCVVTFILTTGL